MAVRTVFANESGTQPASQLDNMYADLWNANTVPCTVSGTNALTFTPRANANLPTSYLPNQKVSFTALATSTGNVFAQIGSLGLLNVYQPAGTQAGAGVIVINTYYEFAYDATLNSGSGGWWITSATATQTSVAQPVAASFQNLAITNISSATATTQITITATSVVVWNSTNGGYTIASFAPPVLNILNSGANGLDTGSVAASSWYFIFAIYNPATATSSSLASLSPTTPTMPSGYTYKARIGAFLTNGSSQITNFIQKGRNAQYVVGVYHGSTLSALPTLASGAIGSITAPTWANYFVGSVVPTATVSKIKLGLTGIALSANNTAIDGAIAAPSNNYGAWNNTTNPPPMALIAVTSVALGSNLSICGNNMADWIVESSFVYYASSVSTSLFQCMGYEDNL